MCMFGFNFCKRRWYQTKFSVMCASLKPKKRHICEKNVGRSGQLATYYKLEEGRMVKRYKRSTLDFTICQIRYVKTNSEALSSLELKKGTFAREMWVVPDSWQLTADVWVGDSNYFNKSRNSRQVELSVRTFLTWSFKSEYTCQNHFLCIVNCKLNES